MHAIPAAHALHGAIVVPQIDCPVNALAYPALQVHATARRKTHIKNVSRSRFTDAITVAMALRKSQTIPAFVAAPAQELPAGQVVPDAVDVPAGQ